MSAAPIARRIKPWTRHRKTMIELVLVLSVAGFLAGLAWLWFEIYQLEKQLRALREDFEARLTRDQKLDFTAYRGPKLTEEQEKELFDQINTLRRDIGRGYDQ